MKKQLVLPLLVILLSSLIACNPVKAVREITTASSQDVQGIIYMKNGVVYEGQLGLPTAVARNIKITTKEGQSLKVPSDSIAYLMVWHKKLTDNDASKLVYTTTKRNKKENEYKIFSGKKWILCVQENPSVAIFTAGQTYSLSSNGRISYKITTPQGTAPDYPMYAQKAGDDMPCYVGGDVSGSFSSGSFSNFGLKYFSDCPEIVTKFKSKELKVRGIADLSTVAGMYNSWKTRNP